MAIATFCSILLSIFCLYIAVSCYRLFVEGTINEHSQIVHEQWLHESARKYCIAAGVFAILAVLQLFIPGHSNEQKSR